MFSENALKVGDENRAKQVARAGMIAELDAVSEYENMLTALGDDSRTKAVINDIIIDEKEHMGMFYHLLMELDTKAKEKLQSGSQLAEKLEEEVF
jgi:rubrerythrin